jgi:hypothetical protein
MVMSEESDLAYENYVYMSNANDVEMKAFTVGWNVGRKKQETKLSNAIGEISILRERIRVFLDTDPYSMCEASALAALEGMNE